MVIQIKIRDAAGRYAATYEPRYSLERPPPDDTWRIELAEHYLGADTDPYQSHPPIHCIACRNFLSLASFWAAELERYLYQLEPAPQSPASPEC